MQLGTTARAQPTSTRLPVVALGSASSKIVSTTNARRLLEILTGISCLRGNPLPLCLCRGRRLELPLAGGHRGGAEDAAAQHGSALGLRGVEALVYRLIQWDGLEAELLLSQRSRTIFSITRRPRSSMSMRCIDSA